MNIRTARIIHYLIASGVITLLTACSVAPRSPAYDLLILNGTIVDGSGASAYEADIAIAGSRIAKIGDLDGVETRRIIDASGLTVSPGFIDLHTHADRNIMENPGIEN
jgi:N-acyl-D-aspartate/D-glutamate deacylase